MQGDKLSTGWHYIQSNQKAPHMPMNMYGLRATDLTHIDEEHLISLLSRKQFHDDISIFCGQENCPARTPRSIFQYYSNQKPCNPHLAVVPGCDQRGDGRFQSQQYSTRRRRNRAQLVYRKQVKLHPLLTRAQYLLVQWRKAVHLTLSNMARHSNPPRKLPTRLQPHHNTHSRADERSSLRLKRDSKDTTDLKHRWTLRSSPWGSQWATLVHQLMMCDLSLR